MKKADRNRAKARVARLLRDLEDVKATLVEARKAFDDGGDHVIGAEMLSDARMGIEDLLEDAELAEEKLDEAVYEAGKEVG